MLVENCLNPSKITIVKNRKKQRGIDEQGTWEKNFKVILTWLLINLENEIHVIV